MMDINNVLKDHGILGSRRAKLINKFYHYFDIITASNNKIIVTKNLTGLDFEPLGFMCTVDLFYRSTSLGTYASTTLTHVTLQDYETYTYSVLGDSSITNKVYCKIYNYYITKDSLRFTLEFYARESTTIEIRNSILKEVNITGIK